DVYCRIAQDSPFTAVRGARNYPCLTVPGKRAPTVKMCESDEQYVPLNDGNNWKGDPNATLSGQDIPQLPPGTPPAQAAPPPGPPPRRLPPRRDPRHHQWRLPNTTRQQVPISDQTGRSTPRPTWHRRHR